MITQTTAQITKITRQITRINIQLTRINTQITLHITLTKITAQITRITVLNTQLTVQITQINHCTDHAKKKKHEKKSKSTKVLTLPFHIQLVHFIAPDELAQTANLFTIR